MNMYPYDLPYRLRHGRSSSKTEYRAYLLLLLLLLFALLRTPGFFGLSITVVI
jgi:hypothetical protein